MEVNCRKKWVSSPKLNQIDGSELWKKVGFKPSEKVLVSLRGVYNLPFNLDDPVAFFQDYKIKRTTDSVKYPVSIPPPTFK